jgi:IclR family acetate operon transcriptional repressor
MISRPAKRAKASDLSSVEKGLLIIRALGSTAKGMTPAELAAETGLNRSTAYRLCEILADDGWVLRIPGDGTRAGKFGIGAAALGMSILITNTYDTTARIQPMIDSLAASVGETVHVGALEQGQIIHIARAAPHANGMRLAAELGSRDFAHSTALGKALLSTLSDIQLRQIFSSEQLPVRSPKTIKTRSQLFVQIEQIRQQGYAIDEEESSPGVKCIAAPVRGPGDAALFAISVTTTPARLEGEKLGKVITAVCACAAMVTTSFGGGAGSPRQRLRVRARI